MFVLYCCAHALSGVTEVVEQLFEEERKDKAAQPRAVYNNVAFNALRELSKSFHPHSEWGFQLFPHYLDFCVDHGISMHERLSSVGRFVGSRHHSQFKLGGKMYVFLFLFSVCVT